MADLDAPAEDEILIHDDEVPVHDIVPIEGASAVLGVPPEERGSPAAADADAVADLLAAYPSARPGGTGAIQGVGVTLIVTDLSRSVAFYRDMLGFYVVDSGLSSAVLASGETRIMLRAVADMPKVDRRLVHLNLEVDNVEAVYAELLGKGVKFIHRPRPVARGEHMELWAAAFRDPDGHGIAIIRWQPTT
jgi:catechol 2,3-dioxygenase-like lactoylglutathione lyase family enzyme